MASFGRTTNTSSHHALSAWPFGGEWNEPQVHGNLRVQSLAAFGDLATQIEPAQTILGAVLVNLAKAASLGNVQALFSMNAYLTAMTSGVVFLIVLVLGYSKKTAAWCALLFGVATIAWPYATTYYRDVLAMFLASLAFLGWAIAFKEEGRRRLLGVVLLAAGILGGILAKNTVAALLPAFGIYGAFYLYRSGIPQSSRRRVLMGGSAVLVGLVAISIALPPSGPLARFSLEYYQGLLGHYVESIGPQLFLASIGPFVSPTKSILLFSPALLLAILGLKDGMRSHPWFMVPAISFALLIALAQGLFYRELWMGAVGWGLRYMLPALPALIVLAAPAVQRALQGRPAYLRTILFAVLILGVLVQLSAVLVDWNLVYRDWQSAGVDPFSPQAAWDVQFLSIPSQLGNLLNPTTWTVAWRRTILAGAVEAAFVPLFAAILIVLFVVVWRGSVRDRWTGSAAPRLFAVLAAVAITLPTLPLWWTFRGDPYWGAGKSEFDGALAWTRDGIEDGDALLIDSYATPLWHFWMNWWNRSEPWYSLEYAVPRVGSADSAAPTVATLSLVDSLEEAYSRMWFVSSSDSPGYGLRAEVEWFGRSYALQSHKSFQGKTLVVESRAYDLLK